MVVVGPGRNLGSAVPWNLGAGTTYTGKEESGGWGSPAAGTTYRGTEEFRGAGGSPGGVS